MAKPNTWQDRGGYLAGCCGMTPQQFALGIDAAMAAARAGNAAGATSNPSSGAARKKAQRKGASATRAKEPAGAGA